MGIEMLRKIIHNTPGYVFPCHQDILPICDCSDLPDLSTPAEFSPNEGGVLVHAHERSLIIFLL